MAKNRNLCLPNVHSMPPLRGSRRNVAMLFGIEKLEWFGYLMVKKNLMMLFVLTEFMNMTDGHTDRDHIMA